MLLGKHRKLMPTASERLVWKATNLQCRFEPIWTNRFCDLFGELYAQFASSNIRQTTRSSMIKNIELDALFQTLLVAEQGSFHKAASLLGVKTSTLSRRVHELEARIGVSLFQRHRHGVRPTDAGRIFFEDI